MKVNTILVPTDFSADADAAIETASELARTLGAKIVILHAYHVSMSMAASVDGAIALPEDFYGHLRVQATSQVEAAAKALEETGLQATAIAASEPASVAICAYAESLPADLIVMGTKGLTGIKHIALGSVAERVVRIAPCPVLTVKAS